MPSTINAKNTTSGVVITPDSSGNLSFQTADTTAMTIDTSQNVGIGTSSPSSVLDVKASLSQIKNTSTTGTNTVQYLASNTGGNFYTALDSSTGSSFGSAYAAVLWHSGNYPMLFATNNTERMRIDSSGNVGIGTTSPSSYAPLSVAATTTNANVGKICSVGLTAGDVGSAGMSVIKYDNNTTTSQIFFKFIINQSANGSGQINANGANACAFGTYSDARLKENITSLPNQLDNILALKPCEFDYIESEGGGHQIGFIAQEMQEVYPDAVGERSDGMLTISGWDKTTARLVKAIQELKAELDTVKAELATLKGAA